MKSTLRSLIFSLLLLGGLFSNERSFGQTPAVAFNPQTTNVVPDQGTITGYSSNNVAVYGFSITVTGAPETIGTVNIKDNVAGGANNLALKFNNARLYSTATSGYNSASPGTQVGTVNLGTGLITISGMNDSFSVGQTKYYYLVVDCIATTAGQFQPYIGYNQSPVGIISSGGTNYNLNNSGFENFINIAAGTPPPFLINNLTSGLTSTANTLVPSQSGVVVFGFSVTTTGNYTINQFNINSTSSALSSYIASAVLYRNTTNDYSTGSKTAIGTATIGTNKINVAGTENVNNTTRYYFLVVTLKNSFPTGDDIQFNFTSGQSPAAAIRTSGSPSPTNTFNISGNSYNYNSSLVTVTSQQASVSSGTITPNQTGIVLFGFGVTSTNAITFTQFNINSNNANISNYFGSGKLYYCPNSTYSVGSRILAGNVAFSGNYATATLSAQNEFDANETGYYFLVADDIGGATSATVAFSFVNGQTTDALVQSVPVTSGYNTFAITGNNFTLPKPTIFVTGANSTSTNGITAGTLVFGQTDIVLLGFGVQGFGASQNFTNINIKTSGSENNYFSNGRLYRSTTAVFPGGTPLYTSSAVNIAGGGFVNCTVNETIPAGSTYYYWFVADYTVTTGPPNNAYTFGFESGQSQLAFWPNPYSTAYNNFNVTGNAFTIATTEDWTGGTSGSFNTASNFTLLNGAGGAVPTPATIVRIGGVAYTNAPVITANTTIGGLTFGTVGTPTVNVNSGTLTLNTAINTLTGSTGTINGAGTVTLASTAISNIGDGSTLNVKGGLTLNNAGTVNMSSTATLNVTGNSTVANTGTFTLQSDADGSATIGPVTGSLTGNFSVQRYISGNHSYSRGYRLISSPVSVSSTNLVWPNLTYISSKTYTTGTGGTNSGFDASGNPTMYIYRENMAPNFATFLTGNSRGIAKINNSNASVFNVDGDAGTFNIPAGNGLLLFFRGDKATTTNPTITTSIATPTTFTAVGRLNQGNVVVKDWFKSTSHLSYTAGTPVSVRGFNLVGNPYASSINWDIITGTSISNTIWVYNPTLKVYATYIAGSDGVGSNSTGNTANIIPSGQGFFVKTTDSTATLTFTEAHKVNAQVPSTNILLASTPVTNTSVKYMRVQVVKDTVNRDESLIFFKDNASTDFVPNEDAEYLKGNSLVNIATIAANNSALAINKQPFPAKSQSIGLNVTVTSNGTYQVTVPEIKNVYNLFDIWLMDAYKKDSVNVKTNPSYTFTATLADTTTFKRRFSLVIRQNPAYSYRLVNFTALKVSTAVQMGWKTENEEDYTKFTLERSTDAGTTYTVLTNISSSRLGGYSFIDASPNLSGTNLYRLKQQDVNGVISYSSVIPIMYSPVATIASDKLISVYPNPAKSTLNIAITQVSPKPPLYTVTITGSNGTTIKTFSSSQPTWQGDVSALSPGTYFIQVINDDNKTVMGRSTFVKM